jgi:hypothetical protein
LPGVCLAGPGNSGINPEFEGTRFTKSGFIPEFDLAHSTNSGINPEFAFFTQTNAEGIRQFVGIRTDHFSGEKNT